MRSRQEHTDMLFGDVTMKATSEGKHYLEYSERMTKTRQGESGNTRSFAPKMFENPGKYRIELYRDILILQKHIFVISIHI